MATITINDYQGGIAQNPESTIANQFAIGQGLDITTPHILTVNQKLKAVGNTELLKAMTVGRHSFGIGGDNVSWYLTATGMDNGLFQWSTTGALWSLLHTYSDNNPLFNGEVIGDYLVTCADPGFNKSYLPYSGGFTHSTNVAVFNSTIGSYNHPIYNNGAIVYVGDGHSLCQYDLTTFSQDILPLGSQDCITDITGDGNYIAILTKNRNGGSADKIYWWDGYSEHWNYKLDLPFFTECLGKIDNILVVFSDQNGSIYQVSPTGWSEVLNKILLREGNTPTQYSAIKSEANSYALSEFGIAGGSSIKATTNFKNKLLFGQQNGNSLYQGIWSICKNNDLLTLNWDWKIDANVYSISNRYLMPNVPPNIYICCAGGTHKVLEIDYSNKVTDAYYESLKLDGGSPTITKRFDFITLKTKPLSVGCSFTIKKKTNEEDNWVPVGTYSGTDRTKQTFPIPSSNIGENIQIRFDFTVSGNNAPEIKSYSIDYAPIRK